MSRKIPPDSLMYSTGGGAGSRLVMRTRWTSPSSPLGDRIADRLVGGVEAAVEPDLDRHTGLAHDRQRLVDPAEVE